jgi:hypothetical protein
MWAEVIRRAGASPSLLDPPPSNILLPTKCKESSKVYIYLTITLYIASINNFTHQQYLNF